jgi:hypothetical protein
MPRVPSTYSAGGGVGVGNCRFGGGSFILCCPFCIVDATSRNTFVGSDMKEFVGSDRKINASASATVTSSYFLHLLGGPRLGIRPPQLLGVRSSNQMTTSY